MNMKDGLPPWSLQFIIVRYPSSANPFPGRYVRPPTWDVRRSACHSSRSLSVGMGFLGTTKMYWCLRIDVIEGQTELILR